MPGGAPCPKSAKLSIMIYTSQTTLDALLVKLLNPSLRERSAIRVLRGVRHIFEMMVVKMKDGKG